MESGIARAMLRTGEAWGMRFCNRRIVISRTIRNLVRHKYGLESSVIPNGVDLPELPTSTSALERQIATNECEFNTSEGVLRTLPATEPSGDWPRGRGLLGLLIFCNLSLGIPIMRQLCEQHGNLMRQCLQRATLARLI
jgi:hypothetical protein